MALTEAGALLTEQQRQLQLAIRAAILRDILLLWPMFDPADFATFDAFAELATILVIQGHATSSGAAAAYLTSFAAAEGESLPPAVVPPPLPRPVVTDALRFAAATGTLNALRAGFALDAAKRNGWVKLAGAATSLVLDGGRRTITETATRAGVSWARVTDGAPCAFCAMLASRGAVYSKGTVSFRAHDHCGCTAEPMFANAALPPRSVQWRAAWEASTQGKSGTDALNAFRAALRTGSTSEAAPPRDGDPSPPDTGGV